jgi:hypothetical protein
MGWFRLGDRVCKKALQPAGESVGEFGTVVGPRGDPAPYQGWVLVEWRPSQELLGAAVAYPNRRSGCVGRSARAAPAGCIGTRNPQPHPPLGRPACSASGGYDTPVGSASAAGDATFLNS